MTTTNWRALHTIKSAAVVPWTGNNLHRCDPYLLWADATTTPCHSDTLDIAALIELLPGDNATDFFERVNAQGATSAGPCLLPNGFEPVSATLFLTALVNRRGLAVLIGEVVAGRLARFTLQNSRPDIARAVQEMWAMFTTSRAARRPSPQTAPGGASPPAGAPAAAGTYLGIIDDGLPVLRIRDSLQLSEKPAHFWDQGWQPADLLGTQMGPQIPGPDDQYWQIAWEFFLPIIIGDNGVFRPPRGFLYGRRLKRLSSAAGAAGANDRDEYFLSRYFTPAPRQTHGAAVLGLLAPWLSAARGPVQWPAHISGLAMVQLPTRTVVDTSGGSLAMRVIDGLRYILWQEQSDSANTAGNRAIVVNVSYGVHAGPHDGTSMFERALAEMLTTHDRLHVVLPAGNAAQTGCHARRVLAGKGSEDAAARMFLQVLPDNGRDTFVEFWLPRRAAVELRIRPPGSPQTYTILPGEAKVHIDADPNDPDEPQRVHFGAVYVEEAAQGTNRAMLLLAIGATRKIHRPREFGLLGLNQQLRREVLGTPGLWELTVRNLGADATTVDAWVERDDAPPDFPGGSRQAYFPDTCCASVRTGNATPENTLSGIATLIHPRLHVVGAMRADGALSDYTAAGDAAPAGSRRGPDVVVPADTSRALAGVRTTGFVRGTVARVNGTSAACAVYARALALQLDTDDSQPPCTQVPPEPPPEITCATDRQPQADPVLRGMGKRCLLPFDVDL